MRIHLRSWLLVLAPAFFILGLLEFPSNRAIGADRLTGLHSAQVMSQSMPWIAQEAGLFKKHDLDFGSFLFRRHRWPRRRL